MPSSVPTTTDVTPALALLLVHSDNALRRALREALQVAGRVVAHDTAKAALISFSRARFDAVVCAPTLTDVDAWRLIRMVRSGRFGFPAVPIIVACEAGEADLYAPLMDQQTYVVALEGEPTRFASSVVQLVADHPRPTLLLVEDDPTAAAAANRALEKYFDVEVTTEGREGLKAWREGRHALVVLDLMLPGMSGHDVQRAILREDPNQPIVILTAFDAPDQCEGLMLSGAADFVSKATSLNDFATHCVRVLQESKYFAAAQQAVGARAKLAIISDRVRAARVTLARGQTRAASAHLQHALAMGAANDVSDDDWSALVAEFDDPSD